MAYTVKAVCNIAGVSVRTLHHYDEIGLLRPAGRSTAGYRLYSEKDLQRLQQVLFFKELGFDLAEIKRVLSDPRFDREAALAEHRKLLLERQERLGRLIRSVDKTLEAMRRGKPMNATMFDGFDAAAYEDEARKRWGGTPEWEQQQQRWKGYSVEDRQAIAAEGQAVVDGLAALMDRDPADPAVQGLIARHHRLINERFFACPPKVYRQIGDGYVDDPRFAAFYDRVKPGLAWFKRDAIRVFCDANRQA